MKIKALIFAALFVSFNAYSAEAPYESVQSIKTMTADFVQINTIKDFGNDQYKGRLSIISGEKALWDYTYPSEAWYLFSKATVQQYDSTNNQLIVYGSEGIASNVLLQILLDLRTVGKKFKMVSEGDTLKLTPKEDLGIKYLYITIKDGVILNMASEDNAGNISRIIFSNVILNKPIADSVFSKVPPKDAEIFQAR